MNAGLKPSIVPTRLGPVECSSDGDGPAVLALHGGMGGHDQSLILARAALPKNGYRILAISRPGYLGTPLSSGRTPELQADLCAALLDAEGIDQAHVIAVSAGGLCALQFALRHPGRCRSLVTVSACTGRLEVSAKMLRRLAVMALLSRVPFAEARMRRRAAENPVNAARRSIADPGLCARTLSHPEAGPLLAALNTGIFEHLRQRIPGTAADLERAQSWVASPLERIAAPALIIHGTADRAVPFAHAQHAANAIPKAALMPIAGGEHVCLFTHLDAVRARVRVFLSGLIRTEPRVSAP